MTTRRQAALLAVILAAAGCAEKPLRVTSAAQAIELAKAQLERQGYPPAERFDVSGDGVVWVVIPYPQPKSGLGYSVVVDPHTGKADIGVYQVATIDEEL